MEAGNILKVVCIVDHGINMTRLLEGSVRSVVVLLTLIHKAFAMAVDLQEGLAAGVVLTHSAGEGLAAKGRGGIHIAGIHAGGHQTTVEQNGSGLCIQMCTCPDRGTDAVTLVGRRIGAGSGHTGAQRVQLLHHVGVAGIAAAGQQNALGCMDADEVTILSILCDHTGNAAVCVLFQLSQTGVEVHAVALALDVLLEHHVAGLFTGAVVYLLHGEHKFGLAHLGVIRPLGFIAGGQVAHIVIRFVFQDAGNKIMHGSGFVDPGLDHALVAAAAHRTGDLAQQLGTVHRGNALLLCFAAVDSAVPVAGVHDGGVLLDDAEVQSVLGGISSGTHAAVACAHDDDIGIPGLGDGSLVDVGLGAQPVVLVAGGQLYAGDNSLALCLCIAILGSFHDSLGGDGGTGNAVDLGRTCSHQLLAQLICGSSTVGCGLTRGVNYNVGDSALREGHGDLDGGGDALGSALIGAGDVGAGCTGSGSAAGSSGGGGAGGCIAGSQSTGGDTAHGGGSGDLQKAFAGDLVHAFLSFLCFFFFVCDTYSIYILLKH